VRRTLSSSDGSSPPAQSIIDKNMQNPRMIRCGSPTSPAHLAAMYSHSGLCSRRCAEISATHASGPTSSNSRVDLLPSRPPRRVATRSCHLQWPFKVDGRSHDDSRGRSFYWYSFQAGGKISLDGLSRRQLALPFAPRLSCPRLPVSTEIHSAMRFSVGARRDLRGRARL